LIKIFKKFFGLDTKRQIEEKNACQKADAIETEKKNVTTFKTKVAGVSHGRRQSHLKRWAKKIDAGEEPDITLVREPENRHDPNAIKVILNEYSERTGEEKEIHIGYLRSQVAGSLAVDMGRGAKVDCWFDDILGGDEDDMSYGMLITVEIERSYKRPTEQVTAATDADFSAPAVKTAQAAEDRYFYLLNRIKTSQAAHRYSEMLQSCRESLPLLKGLVKVTRAESGSFDIKSIPAIEIGCQYWPAMGDTKSLVAVAATVNSIPAIKEGWGYTVALAQDRAVLADRVYSHIANHPGVIQSTLKDSFDVTAADIREVAYFMERVGRIQREKSGSSYKLYISGANSPE